MYWKIKLCKKGFTSCVRERTDLCYGDNKKGVGSMIVLYKVDIS